jgi:predicted Zn-dependent protease
MILPALCLFALLPPGVLAQNGGRGQAAEALERMGRALVEMPASEEDFSPLDEYILGRAVGVEVLNRYRPLRNNAALTGYLNRICEAVVANSPNPVLYNGYHVMILDSPQINAFATSGGHIFVTMGLVGCADSEDALAAVIAHEIAHVQLRHSMTALRTARTVAQLRALGNESARRAAQFQPIDERRRAFEESIRVSVDSMLDNGYSQTQEFEADALALELLRRAGYRPAALMDMLRALQQRQGVVTGGFNSTHPAPALRMGNAEALLRSMPGSRDTAASRLARFRELRR